MQYDPAKSETYKAIQESEHGDLHAQEISKPVQPKVFTPVQGTVKVEYKNLMILKFLFSLLVILFILNKLIIVCCCIVLQKAPISNGHNHNVSFYYSILFIVDIKNKIVVFYVYNQC